MKSFRSWIAWHPTMAATSDGDGAPRQGWSLRARLLIFVSIALWPIAGGDPRPVRGLLPGEFPVRWSIDGNVLYTALPEEGRRAMQLARVDLATGKRTVWKNLVPADAVGATRIGNPMVSPDGSAYAYTYGSHVSDLYLVEGLK